MIEVLIGIVLGVVGTGWLAHRKPALFNKDVTLVADAVNNVIDKSKTQ